MTFSPAAFIALALASTARVADSAMDAKRDDVRREVAVFRWGEELMPAMLTQ
jgi:hypothetical protein